MLHKLIHELRFPAVLSIVAGCFFICFSTSTIAQTTINFGDYALKMKKFQYAKYEVRITPRILLKDQYSLNFDIVFELKWYDKDGRMGHTIEGVDAYLADNNLNLSKYCENIDKMLINKLNIDPGMSKYSSSINFHPKDSFIVGQLIDGFIIRESKPLKVFMNDYYTSAISFDLTLYFVNKDKKNKLEIIGKSPPLRWEFVLPERKTNENYSCEEQVRQYKIEFENQRFTESFSGLDEKFNSYQNTQPSINDWQRLEKSVIDFKSGIEKLKPILQLLQNNKDTTWCKELSKLKSEIENYLADEKELNELHNNIAKAIQSLNTASVNTVKSASPTSTSAPTFEENSFKLGKYYIVLYDLDKAVDGNKNIEKSILEAYRDSVNILKILQESMVQQAGAKIDQPPISLYIKKFNADYEGINEIFNKYISENEPFPETPIITTTTEEDPDDKNRFPILWVLMPVVLVGLGAFGGAKFYPYLKKGGGLKSKLKR